MRWEALFADLEAQAAAAESADLASRTAEMVRAEFARTALSERVRARLGSAASVRLRDGRWVEGVVVEVAAEWLLLTTQDRPDRPDRPDRSGGPAGAQVLLPLAAVERLRGLDHRSAPGRGVVASLGITTALRALARDRAVVTVMLASGDLTGTVDRVGRDHVDVAVHPADVPRRPAVVTEVATVPLTALLGVRSRG